MCVFAYTNEILDFEKRYSNGNMSNMLFNKLKYKKDYYFIVLNKTDSSDIIVNSVKGLTKLTSNNNNLPFQVSWNKNKLFTYQNINTTVHLFIDCLKKPKPNWKEISLSNIRHL